MVRQRSAKPPFPGSNPGAASIKESGSLLRPVFFCLFSDTNGNSSLRGEFKTRQRSYDSICLEGILCNWSMWFCGRYDSHKNPGIVQGVRSSSLRNTKRFLPVLRPFEGRGVWLKSAHEEGRFHLPEGRLSKILQDLLSFSLS